MTGREAQITRLPTPQLSLALLAAGSLVVGWHSLVSTFTLAWRNDEYTHILLILPVSLTLIILEWSSLRQMVAPEARLGAALLAAPILIAGATKVWFSSLNPDVRLSIGMFALVLFWMGAFVFCLGTRVARSLLFPLCFMFWLVPFPQVALAWIIGLLQQGSAWAAHALFSASGVPVSHDGVILTIPGLTVEVAQECSSIRSSLMLLVTTMVLAQLLLRSPWRKVLIIAIAVPLSVAKNGLRIFTIAMLGTRVDPGYLTGRLHHQGGVVFLTVALVIVMGLIWLLMRGESKSDRPTALKPVTS